MVRAHATTVVRIKLGRGGQHRGRPQYRNDYLGLEMRHLRDGFSQSDELFAIA